MAHKRLSSLATNAMSADKPLPTHPPPSDSASDRGRLRKPQPSSATHSRTPSGNYFAPQGEPTLPNLQQLQDLSGAPSPLLPPPVIGGGTYSRSSSMDRSLPGTPATSGSYNSRPGTPVSGTPGQSPILSPNSPAGTGKERKKKGWFGGGRKDDGENNGPLAWVAGSPHQLPYDTEVLVHGRPMKELWEDVEGNCYVYLFPRGTGKGASFKVDSAIFASSQVLTKMAFGDMHGTPNIQLGGARHQPPLDVRMQGMSLNDPSTPPSTPPQMRRTPGKTDTMTSSSSNDSRGRLSNLSDRPAEAHLYLPINFKTDATFNAPLQASPRKDKTAPPDPALDDLQTLVDIRNTFAFLCGQALIATRQKHSLFQIFMTISGILRAYEFSNLDGSTFGEIASSSFDAYVEELALADVRGSREKTIEGLVLSERMKSVFLFNEAFTHAAGKHDLLIDMQSSKYGLISGVIQTRLTRAAMDLDKRTASIRLYLTDFEFPALFNGIMSSKTSEERKGGVRFDAWKEGFLSFRKNLLGFLKAKYGAWPPKASSKKNDLETSGLNRLVVRDLYKDMSTLYDLLVDRNNLTTRSVDASHDEKRPEDPTITGLRAVLSEYDRSSPPVKPPIPFDLPLLPNIRSTRPDFGSDKKKDVKALTKKLKDDEIANLLRASRNPDIPTANSPFLQMFLDMEARAAHNCTISDILDLRIGQWIFLYVVLQALPMLACDAPGLKFTKGVEYFLCEPPRGGVPWATGNCGVGRTWFSVEGGGGVVSLPSDVVAHGVEGIYRRSHCWVVAERWTRANPALNSALHEHEAVHGRSAGGSPRVSGEGRLGVPGAVGSRPQSRDASAKRLSSLGIGLEALPLPVGVTPDGPVSSGYSPSGYSPSGYPPRGVQSFGYQPPVPTGYSSAHNSRPSTPGAGTPGAGGPVGGVPHVVDSKKTFDDILAAVGQGQQGGKDGKGRWRK